MEFMFACSVYERLQLHKKINQQKGHQVFCFLQSTHSSATMADGNGIKNGTTGGAGNGTTGGAANQNGMTGGENAANKNGTKGDSASNHGTKGVDGDVENFASLLVYLKRSRATSKGTLTKKIKRLKYLVDIDGGTLSDDVNKAVIEVKAALNVFKYACQHYKNEISDDAEIIEACKYQSEVEVSVAQLLEHVMKAETIISPDDSVSQRGSRVSRSRSSLTTNSVVSAKMKAAAKKASLLVQASALGEAQDLEKEALKIQHKKQELTLRTEIASADAEGRVYEMQSGVSDVSLHSKPVHAKHFQRVPFEDIKNDSPNGNVKLSHVDSKPSVLNPNAPEWQDVKNGVSQNNTNTEFMQTISQQQRLLEFMQLPKAELVTFDGDPLQYWTFIRSFENTVGQSHIDDNSKLTRLLQYCTGSARKVIQCTAVMHTDEGYKKARQLLKERFGNEYEICNAWVQKIRKTKIIRDHDRHALREFSDDLIVCNEILQALNKVEEMNQSILVSIITKVPVYLQNRWKREARIIKSKFQRSPNFADMVRFIQEAAEEANDPVFGSITDKFQRSSDYKQTNSSRGLSSFGVQGETDESNECISNVCEKDDISNVDVNALSLRLCPLCNLEHSLFKCEKFRQMSVAERLRFTREKRLCDNCLLPGHIAFICKRENRCTVPGCSKKHTAFLHIPKEYPVQNNNVIGNEEISRCMGAGDTNTKTEVCVEPSQHNSEVQTSKVCNRTGINSSQKIALPVAPVKIQSVDGTFSVVTNALLDGGSTNTFCSDNLLKQLGLKGITKTIDLTTISMKDIPTQIELVDLNICGLYSEQVISIPKVHSKPGFFVDPGCIAKKEDLSEWSHLSDIPLVEFTPESVQLLIGQDCPEVLMPLEIRKATEKGAPYAVRGILGWTVNGPLGLNKGHHKTQPVSTNFLTSKEDIREQVERFWRYEGDSDETVTMSLDDKRAVHIWEETICHKDGHYQMGIPFKIRPPALPNNLSVAEFRLQSLRRRLLRDQELYSKYSGGMQDLIDKGYAEKVPVSDLSRNDGKVWYLPHHPVFHPKKPDKVRIVFDCAARFKEQSLNDEILRGPDYINSLIGVLLRFRQAPIAFMSDIEGMFHQVKVSLDDRDVLRFLWWPNHDLSREPEVFRMAAHLFGGVWSPSCCSFALRRTADDNSKEFPVEVISTVKRNFYVDDCLKSVDTENNAIEMSNQLISLLKKGGFRLTKWMSNSRSVLRSVPEEDRAKGIQSLDLEKESLPVERALGVGWDVEKDDFGFQVTDKKKPLTKRGILSVVSSVFDPLGLVSPFVLPAKLIFQELCRQKLGWDEPLPESELDQWLRWLGDLSKIENFKLNRCFVPEGFGNVVSYQLHHFSDASEKGYGVTSYLRAQNAEGKVHCSLVMAKTRLAPLKSVTIPRLELIAATLSVKIDKVLKRELEFPIQETFFWTDSMIVIQYIENENTRFKTFVANRLTIIHEGTVPSQWNYVPTAENPADDASRGMSAEGLIKCDRWTQGPGFLWQKREDWPKRKKETNNLIENSEIKKSTKVYMTERPKQDESTVTHLLERYSSWYKLKKSVAWLLRFKQFLKCRVSKNSGRNKTTMCTEGPISVKELKSAELEIVKYVQIQSFPHEMAVLQVQGKNVAKTSPISKLDPVINSGILCVGGRLRNAHCSENMKHQMLLPKRHHIVNLIVQNYHQMSGHSGSEHVLSLVRQRFWIISGRTAVRQTVRNCFDCKKRLATPSTQKMADLPKDRVIPNKPPFTNVGVDYFGPFLVKRGRARVKRYGCIFTCLISRAVHVEVAHSLDTDSFICALNRFISRRGRPEEIRSDNGTNFVGAERELSDAISTWNETKIVNFLLQREIQWKFNPPYASHMGGVWERQIRTVRKVLNALVKEQVLDDEGLMTLMCEAESIVNGRPLTMVSSDPKDYEPLTPNHLLLLRSGPKIPPGLFSENDLYCRKRWRQIQYLSDVFWKRWTKEYLSSMQIRQKWLKDETNLKVGDLVLIVCDTPRNVWPLGKIVEVFVGQDGKVRSVRVQTQNSIMVRPIHKLCFIESTQD